VKTPKKSIIKISDMDLGVLNRAPITGIRTRLYSKTRTSFEKWRKLPPDILVNIS
jgi:hypothetical protein